MKYIELDTWERREYFNAYLGTDFPYINIGADLDITSLLRFSETNGLSSYLTMIHSAHHVAEQIENFRYRIKDGKPIINEHMCPTFTHLSEGSDLFVNVIVRFNKNVFEFHDEASRQIAKQGTDPGYAQLKGRCDIIGYSAIPWIQYTHFIRTIARIGVDSNPKISWGKYFQQGGRTLMPFSVQVHHGLMDGLHVGKYFESLQSYLNGLSPGKAQSVA